MQFRYKINLEVDVLMDVPLLGADTTVFGRRKANDIAKEYLDTLLASHHDSGTSISKIIDQTSFKAKVTGKTEFHSARGQSL
jgi:hypothetical protein